MELARNGRLYGDGRLFGNNRDSFFEQTIIEQALELGWSNACPVATSLIEPIKDGGRSAEVMRVRYAQVNFWYGYIASTLVQQGRMDLYEELASIQPRNSGEPLGKHDPNWVPDQLHEYILGAGSPYGYAMPRVLLEFINNKSESERADYLFDAMQDLQELIGTAPTIANLLVTFGERLAQKEIDSNGVRNLLRHILSQGKLNEDNCFATFNEIASIMREAAPVLWSTYTALTTRDKLELHIADVA